MIKIFEHSISLCYEFYYTKTKIIIIVIFIFKNSKIFLIKANKTQKTFCQVLYKKENSTKQLVEFFIFQCLTYIKTKLTRTRY